MGKVTTTKIPKNHRLYIPKAVRRIMELSDGDEVDWFLGTDINVRRMISSDLIRQELIILHVKSS